MFASLKTSIATSLTALTISLALSASPADANGFRMGGGHGGFGGGHGGFGGFHGGFHGPGGFHGGGFHRVGWGWRGHRWGPGFGVRLHRRRRRLHRVPIELRRRGQLPWPVPGERLPVNRAIESGGERQRRRRPPEVVRDNSGNQRVCVNKQAISRCVCRITVPSAAL